MNEPVALVVAKAPVPGLAKTRLAAVVGAERAADLAAAALLDSMRACVAAFGVERCHLAFTGDLDAAARAPELREAIDGWTVHEQRGDDFAQRLHHAHHDVAVTAAAPVIQIGMDTPQVEARHLHDAAALVRHDASAVLGPAADGGWWLLGVGSPRLVEHLGVVPMSTDRTCDLTREALVRAGADVVRTETLRDVDEVADAEHVARTAPGTLFARAWSS